METITSLKNPKVALWRSLKDTKARRETGLFLVEGRKMTLEAISCGFEVSAVLVTEENAAEPALSGQPLFLLPAHVLAAVCDTKTPQGMAAVLRRRTLPLRGRRLLALDDVQDPGNVGTILRTADAAGLDGVLMTPGCADPFSPKVLRATMGSIFRMPVQLTEDLPAALRQLAASGCAVISSELSGAPFYARSGIGDAFCLIIGNEGNGVSPAVSACATHRLKLPMRGGAESLNAAIAAGIMMYDLMREVPEEGENP